MSLIRFVATRSLWLPWMVLALALSPWHARADDAPASAYPVKPVRLVVPFPVGGGADTLARLLAPKLEQTLGQTIVIENRAGAGGNLGAEFVAHAAPDGYTLLYGTNGTHAINPSLYRRLPFDPLKDFVPISRMTEISTMLIVNPQLPVYSVAELVAYAEAHPGQLNFASAGNGTTSHLAGELFKTRTGVDIVHVPYGGGGPAMVGLIGQQAQLMIEVMPSAYPRARAGQVRALAVASARRFPGAPEIPTMGESGLPGFEATAWDGLFAPAGTPPAIIGRLSTAIRDALADPELVAALRARGAEPSPMATEPFIRFIADSMRAWAQAVRSSGASVN